MLRALSLTPRLVVITLALVSALSACGGTSDVATRDDLPTPIAAIPNASCALPLIDEGSAQLVAALAPQGIDWAGARSNPDWAPSTVTAVLPLGDSLVVLDGTQSLLTLFNGRLEPVATFGTAGEGPGEFRRASALAIVDGGRIAVADPGTKRLTVLTPALTFAESRPIAVGQIIDGIAFSGGDLYVTEMILPEMASRTAAFRRALSVVHSGSDSASPVVELTPGSAMADSLLRLPGPNSFRVVVDARVVLFIAPAAGIVDLFRDGRRAVRLTTCMPASLDEALRQQRAEYRTGSGAGAQQFIPLVSDAIVRADTIFLVGPVPTSEGRLHVDAYHLDGTPIGSILVEVGDLKFPGEMRFWGAPDQLVAYGADGVVLRLRIVKRP